MYTLFEVGLTFEPKDESPSLVEGDAASLGNGHTAGIGGEGH